MTKLSIISFICLFFMMVATPTLWALGIEIAITVFSFTMGLFGYLVIAIHVSIKKKQKQLEEREPQKTGLE